MQLIILEHLEVAGLVPLIMLVYYAPDVFLSVERVSLYLDCLPSVPMDPDTVACVLRRSWSFISAIEMDKI